MNSKYPDLIPFFNSLFVCLLLWLCHHRGWIGRLPSITQLSHLKRGAASIRQVLQICPVELPEQDQETGRISVATRLGTVNGTGTTTSDADDWLEYGAAELQTRNTRRRLEARYNVQAEFLQPAGWISRTPERKIRSCR